MWSFVAEAFSGSVVEPVLRQGYLVVRDLFESAVFGKELADKSVEVFVGAAFPGGMGMGEVVVQLQVCCDPLMLGELLAVVGGQSMNQPCKGLEFCEDGPAHDRSLFTGHALDQRISAFALVDGDQRLRMTRADDQISLPIAIPLSAVHDGRTLIDRDLVGDGAASLAHAAPFAPLLVDAQRQVERPTRAFVLIDALIDGLVRDARQLLSALMAGDLLWTPGLGQFLLCKAPRLGRYATRIVGARPSSDLGQHNGYLRLIGACEAVAAKLAADCRRGPFQLGCDGLLRKTCLVKGGDLVSFFLDEMAVAHSWQSLLGGEASRILPHPIHLPLELPVALRC